MFDQSLSVAVSLVFCYFLFPSNWQVPPTLRFVMDGEMPDYLLAKDLILQVSSAKPILFFTSLSFGI